VEYGFLGVSLPRSSDPRVRATPGAVVQSTLEGTPAGRSLLENGDVITHVNDQEIREPDELLLHVGKLPPEAGVRLTVERDGQVRTIEIPELAKYWVARKKIITNRPPAWRGMRVDYVTASPDLRIWAEQRRIDPQGSVLITEVDENSPAWNEGLRPAMMISHVGSQRVTTPREFRQAVADKAGPVQLRLSPPPDDRPVRTIPPEAS
jgi:S1-C subfamily serine protease